MKKSQAKINVVDWFDVQNIEHLKAFSVFEYKGVWPKGFILQDMEFPEGWIISIAFKLAKAYIDEKVTPQA